MAPNHPISAAMPDALHAGLNVSASQMQDKRSSGTPTLAPRQNGRVRKPWIVGKN